MKSKFKAVIGRVAVVFFIIAGIVSFASLHSLTLANPWLIGLGALVVAAAPGVMIASKDTLVLPLRQPALRMVVWIAVLTVVADGAFYGINYLGAVGKEADEIGATVEKKYFVTRQRTKRIGRRVYTSNGSYEVPYADLLLDDGHRVTLRLHGKEALSTSRGDRFRVKTARGAFGVKVAFRGSFVNTSKPKHHKTKKHHNHEKILL